MNTNELALKYKGYSSRPLTVDVTLGVFHGQVDGIRDVVSFEGKNAKEIVKAFHEAVDDYLEYCTSRGRDPEKPFSGKFIIRISPELHEKAAIAARSSAQSLNAWVALTIEHAVSFQEQLDEFCVSHKRGPYQTHKVQVRTEIPQMYYYSASGHSGPLGPECEWGVPLPGVLPRSIRITDSSNKRFEEPFSWQTVSIEPQFSKR